MDTKELLFQNLTPPQLDAVKSKGRRVLVVAGAGSGKTNTLAHRVAHLVVHGADPRRILLMTFSRRAAAEMARRVQRIVGNRIQFELVAAGTGNQLGWYVSRYRARLLRECAHQIGLDPSFTIHDRDDSADLMNLVRHELGFSTKANRGFRYRRSPAGRATAATLSAQLRFNGQVAAQITRLKFVSARCTGARNSISFKPDLLARHDLDHRICIRAKIGRRLTVISSRSSSMRVRCGSTWTIPARRPVPFSPRGFPSSSLRSATAHLLPRQHFRDRYERLLSDR